MPFSKAIKAWNDLRPFRDERERCKKFVFGNQWADSRRIEGHDIPEESLYGLAGQTPLKNNILRRIVRNVTGVYRAQYKVPHASRDEYGQHANSINKRRREIFRANRMEELLPRLLEEYLISGMAAVKIAGRTALPQSPAKGGKIIIPVTLDNFFFHSDGYDPRGWDIDLIGEVHTLSLETLIATFCSSPQEVENVVGIYGSNPLTNCKITEIWQKHFDFQAIVHDTEAGSLRKINCADLLAENPGRNADLSSGFLLPATESWICSWHADDGTLLRRDSPSKSHPYVMKAYPYLDGEVHSYISDLIDQQKYVNHLITLYDYIMRSSAKGVLLIPEETIPNGTTAGEMANAWVQFNGVIPYKAVPGVPAPTQVNCNSTGIGITDLLKIQMQLLEDISGVSPTLQGKLQNANASGSLFARQNEAAVTSLLDVLRSFDSFADETARRLSR